MLAVDFFFCWAEAEAASWLVLLGERRGLVWGGEEGVERDVQAGITLADYALCLSELSGAFLDAHGGLRLLMRAVRISCVCRYR